MLSPILRLLKKGPYLTGSFILLLFLVPPLSSKALDQDFSLKDIHSLEQLLEIAKEEDPTIQSMELQLREAEAGLRGLYGALDPQLIISGEHMVENVVHHSIASQFVSIEFEWEDEIYKVELLEPHELIHTTIGSITIAHQLGFNASLRKALERATLGQEMSILQKEEGLSQLALQVKSSFHRVLKAYYNMQLAQEVVEHAKWNLEMVQHRESEKTATMLDVLQEKNALFEAENQRSTAKMGLQIATLGLLQTIGLEPSHHHHVESFVEQFDPYKKREVEEWSLDLDRAIDFALKNRPEIRLAKMQLEMAEIDLEEHIETRDWTINLTGRYMMDDYIFDGSLDSNRLFRGTVATSKIRWPDDTIEDLLGSSNMDTDPWQVGVQINYTFGHESRKESEEEMLLSTSKRGEIQYNTAKDGIYLEVYSLYQQLEQSWRSYQFALKAEREAEETYKKLEEMYNLGSATKKNLLEGSLFLTQAKNHVLSTSLDYRLQKGEFARALGIDSSTLEQALVGNIKWSLLSLEEGD